jgi:hypothetical protein
MARLARGLLWVWASLLLILPGCASTAVAPPVSLPLPEYLIKRLEQEDGKVRSLKAWGNIKVTRKGERESADHAILMRRPDALRVEGVSPLGSSVYSLLILRGEIELFVPSEGKAYRGAATAQVLERLFALPMSPEAALSVLCGRVPLCPVGEATVEKEGALYALEVACEDGGWRQRVRLDPTHLDPVRLSLRDPLGREVLVVAWSGFRSSGDTRIPTEIQVDLPLKGDRLSLRLEDFDVNPQVPEDRFRLIIPPGTKILPLS